MGDSESGESTRRGSSSSPRVPHSNSYRGRDNSYPGVPLSASYSRDSREGGSYPGAHRGSQHGHHASPRDEHAAYLTGLWQPGGSHHGPGGNAHQHPGTVEPLGGDRQPGAGHIQGATGQPPGTGQQQPGAGRQPGGEPGAEEGGRERSRDFFARSFGDAALFRIQSLRSRSADSKPRPPTILEGVYNSIHDFLVSVPAAMAEPSHDGANSRADSGDIHRRFNPFWYRTVRA